VIAFGAAITKPDVYRACAEPGIRRAMEPDSVVLASDSLGSLQASYNATIDRAAELEGLEALVLVHQDAEIVDTDFAARIRAALADPEVGVAGCVGAVGVRSIAWWEGSVTLASFVHRYAEHGGGDLPSFSWTWGAAPPYARLGEVDTVDGFLLVLSPWAVRNVRFDESLGRLHGYDLDFCLQVREAGKKVVTADVHAIHNHSLDLINDHEGWVAAHVKVAEKWEHRMPQIGAGAGSWRRRALVADAERAAARVEGHRNALLADAHVAELEGAIAEATGSISWRLTAPLRLLAGGRAGRPARRGRLRAA
jgi:hypothetical protein